MQEKSKLVQRVLPTRSHSSRTAAKPAMAVVAPEQREMEREVQELLKSMLKQQHKEVCVYTNVHAMVTHVQPAHLHTHTKGCEMMKYSQFARLVLLKAH